LLSIERAKKELYDLKDKGKFEKMLFTAAILTDLLMQHDIKPIIVGGLSVEIYTMNGYTTQDIDFIINGHEMASEIFGKLDFKKLGKDWIHPTLGVSLEIPNNHLAGDYNKVTTFPVDDKVVYLIGIEDIILDRLRAAVHWHSGEDREWGFRMLLMYIDDIELEYIKSQINNLQESEEFEHWLVEANRTNNEILEQRE
jgi:hypothetical protein